MYLYQGNKTNEAFTAAYRLVKMCESAGINLSDPDSIARGNYDEYMPDDMQYASGASRLVIWDEWCDFVIKIPLLESYEKYCKHEVEIFKDAIKSGLDDRFAWCACYSESYYDDNQFIPGIYVMEYIDCNEDDMYDHAWCHGYKSFCEIKGYDSSNYDAAEEYNDWNNADDYDMVLDYLESDMDSETRKAFCIFMTKWLITDIHQANVGFKGNKVIIVDYAGWNW